MYMYPFKDIFDTYTKQRTMDMGNSYKTVSNYANTSLVRLLSL